MAEPHEQQTNTAPQSHSNQSISRPDVDMDQASNVPNRLSVDQGDTIVSLLQGIQQTINRVEERVNGVEEIVERVKRVEDKVDRVEERVKGVEERVKVVEERVRRIEDKVGRVEDKIYRVEERVARVGDKVDRVGDKVYRVGERVKRVEEKIEQVERNTEKAGRNLQRFEEKVEQKFQRLEQQVVQVGEKVEQMGQNFQRLEERVGQVEAEDKQARQDINYIFKDLDFMPIRIHNSGAPENAQLRYPRHIIPAYPPLPHSMQELAHMTDQKMPSAKPLPPIWNFLHSQMMRLREIGGCSWYDTWENLWSKNLWVSRYSSAVG
ncbi:hypothetical protein HOY82DRAFT_542990 [Tuber indicum]|nr:hypothetical protein HOY82DRAFT_542990 [Tuber indicum]